MSIVMREFKDAAEMTAYLQTEGQEALIIDFKEYKPGHHKAPPRDQTLILAKLWVPFTDTVVESVGHNLLVINAKDNVGGTTSGKWWVRGADDTAPWDDDGANVNLINAANASNNDGSVATAMRKFMIGGTNPDGVTGLNGKAFQLDTIQIHVHGTLKNGSSEEFEIYGETATGGLEQIGTTISKALVTDTSVNVVLQGDIQLYKAIHICTNGIPVDTTSVRVDMYLSASPL